ncbi:MAG TPA: 4'-phosphopantetheinyl transferase superfamily protein [Casimicrobiaceae bacterium]
MSVDDFHEPGNAQHVPLELPSPAANISLWWATLEAGDIDFARLSSWLAPAEHARAARFGRESLRRRYVVGRASLRWVLARALGLSPGTVPIVRGERGRPHLQRQCDLDFNVSHTDDVALIGIARGCRIGVDVERTDREVHADGLARKFLTPSEQTMLAPLGETARRERFLRYWTCKEAMSKATGEGLSAPFRQLEVRLAETIELLDGPGPYRPSRWRLHAAQVPTGFFATAALWSRDPPGPG